MNDHAAESLAAHYRHFDVQHRTLLTGHSHQAWPDVGRQAQLDAWTDAAAHVDDKWSYAFEKAARVKRGFGRLLAETDENRFALAGNTHELLVRFISSLPLRDKPRIITTDGEFHSMRRQLARLAEEGVEVIRAPASPVHTLAERVRDAATETTAAVMMSAVLFRDAAIVPNLAAVQERCSQLGVPFLVDAYHAINVMPFEIPQLGLEQSYVVGGGYKYCQLGEGNCFMRVPVDCDARPVVTGWYAEFSDLEQTASGVPYPQGADRFQGSTYDPTSHYRAAAVFDFFSEQGLTPDVLRKISQRQIGLLIETFDELDLNPDLIQRPERPITETGGFLSLQTRHAARLQADLKAHNIWTDYRDDCIRLGPAPYVSETQLTHAVEVLSETLTSIDSSI